VGIQDALGENSVTEFRVDPVPQQWATACGNLRSRKSCDTRERTVANYRCGWWVQPIDATPS